MAEEQKQPPAQENTEPQQPQQPAAKPQQAMESQVTSKTPTTKPEKNQNRVEAGRRTAEKRKQALEAQKQALAEAHATIEKYKRAEATSSPAPEPAPETEPKPAAADSNGFTTNQWLTIIGIFAMFFTAYVKLDNIKAFFGKKEDNPPELTPVEPAPQVTHESPPQPVLSPPQTKKGIRPMD